MTNEGPFIDPLAASSFPEFDRFVGPPRDETVKSYTKRMGRWYEESIRDSSEVTDPRPEVAHMLVSYLHSVCKLSANQSRLVTMQIGNKHFEWNYRATRNEYEVEDCDAVRMLIGRYRRTLSKKRT